MTFETIETSRALGDAVELYYFRYGTDAGAFEAYTDAATDQLGPGSLEAEAVTYAAAPISRAAITSSGTLDKTTLEVRAPRDIALADQFRTYPPSAVVTAIIRQAHLGATDGASPPVLDAPAIWVGRVVGMKFEGSEAVFLLEPISTSLRRVGLRVTYQRGCQRALYFGKCRADRAHATVTVNVSDVGATSIVLPAGWFGAIPVEKYLGGLVQWTTPEGDTELRTILRIENGKDLALNGLVRGLAGGSPGDPVAISLGCNHQEDDCRDLHVETGSGSPLQSNIHNYPGYGDRAPTVNPIGFNNQFS